jgi:D-alanyl-D-alanine carboxypeptidase/D-alanyl-D-alanine-endopeptidase (penicillin-binding protein 4)
VSLGASRKIAALCVTAVLASATVAFATSKATSTGGVSGPSGSSGATATTGVTTAPPVASALEKLDKTMSGAMRSLGPHSGAYVYDLDTGQVLFDVDGAVPRYPASVEKLYTLSTALALFGPGGTLQTGVYGTGTLGPGGVWDGNLYLKGGGDPTFGDARFIKDWYGTGTSAGALAAQLLARTHITRVDGAVFGDESYFDALRGGPSTNYAPDPNLVGELSALSFDRGAIGRQGNPAAHAAWEFAGTLRRAGVTISGKSQQGVTPVGAQLLASINSPPMTTLSKLTATPSDDFFAEMILKALGARFGAGGTTAAGAAVVTKFLAGLHITPVIADGSGLSRGDLTSPAQVVELLRDISPGGVSSLQTVGADLHASLAIDGETGTLVTRMIGTAAQGNCQAKTGTLSNASDLAGWCDRRYVFALLMNSVDVYRAQVAQDKIVEALARYAKATGAAPAPSSSRKPASSSTATPSR